MSPRQDPANPILEVTRQGSIYSSPAGRFEIRQMERDAVRGILSLWATFEMPFGGGQAITGEIRYDAEAASARTFVVSKDRDLRLLAAKPRWFLQVEPVGSAFAVGSLDIETVRLIRRDHQGDLREVRPLTAESGAPSDRDGNGKPELALCFERDDLRRFFDDVHGSTDVTVELVATIGTGERVREPVLVHVTGVYGASISAAPNPLNPGTTVSYYSEAAGHVAIRVFDVAGRLVYTLVDANQPSGYHSTTWFGRSASGPRLASGVYYLRLETPSGTQTLPIVLLR
jgi:hypothetical protein